MHMISFISCLQRIFEDFFWWGFFVISSNDHFQSHIITQKFKSYDLSCLSQKIAAGEQ